MPIHNRYIPDTYQYKIAGFSTRVFSELFALHECIGMYCGMLWYVVCMYLACIMKWCQSVLATLSIHTTTYNTYTPLFLRRRFAAALIPRLFGTNPRSHHKGATGRVRTGDQRLPVLCHCQLGQDISIHTNSPKTSQYVQIHPIHTTCIHTNTILYLQIHTNTDIYRQKPTNTYNHYIQIHANIDQSPLHSIQCMHTNTIVIHTINSIQVAKSIQINTVTYKCNAIRTNTYNTMNTYHFSKS